MDPEDNPLKNRCRKILDTERKYQQSEIAYLSDQLKREDQYVLEEQLKTLTYQELKIAIRAGVPGHCNFIALGLLQEYKNKIDAYIHSTE